MESMVLVVALMKSMVLVVAMVESIFLVNHMVNASMERMVKSEFFQDLGYFKKGYVIICSFSKPRGTC